MRNKLKIFFLGFTIIFSVFMFEGVLSPELAQAAPFVQCGNQEGGNLDANGNLPGCKFEDLFYTAARIINYLFLASGIVAVLGVIIGGIKMVVSAGNETAITSGRKAVKNSLIGLIIVLLSVSIIQIVLQLLQFDGPSNIIENPVDYLKSGN